MKMLKRMINSFIVMGLMAGLLMTTPFVANAAGGNMEDAQSVQVGEKIKSDVLKKGTEDWYQFTTSNNSNAWFRVGYVSKDSNLSLYICNEDGKELMHLDAYKTKEMVDHLKLEPETDYYLKFEIGMGVLAESTTYTFSVQELADVAPESEEGAIELKNGVKYNGSFECVRDDDWYTFTADSSNTSVDLSVKFNKGLVLKAYNEDGAELKKMSIGDKKTATLQFDTIKGEVYFIEVHSGNYTDYNDNSSGQYNLQRKSGTIKISETDMKDVKNMTYTGKALTPNVNIYNGTTKLIKGKDYILSYQNNIKIGKAMVTIKGKGIYTGTVMKSFHIVAK